MKKLGSLLILFIMIIIIPSVFAGTSYNNTGAENQQFLVGTGIFNQELTTSVIDSRAFGADITNIPLVADLDNDGTNEIIVVVGNIVRVIDANLDNLEVITLTSGSYTIPVLSDIDNDNFTEIIIANEVEANISILQYNGSTLVLETNFTVPHTDVTGTERGMIACNDGEGGTEGIKCLLVITLDETGAGASNITGTLFNASDVGRTETILTHPSDPLCLSQIPVIAVADYDVDGRDEFIFTFTEFQVSATEKLFIKYVNDSLDLIFSTELSTTLITDYNPVVGVSSCDDASTIKNVGRFFTSPMVAEVNGEAGLETIVGINNDAQDFKIHVFDFEGDEIDQHPAFFQADGEIISNVMLSNVFGDTGTVDYCVLGHDDDDQQINLLCGSQETGNIVQSVEFKFNTDTRFNVTKEFPKQNMISHMAQHSNLAVDIEGEGTTDTTELVTSYGVFRMNDDTFNGSFFIKSLNIIFSSPVGDSACIQVDVQEQGSEEFLCVEGNQIFFVNDGVENAPAEITSITYNPCVVDSIIKQNETLQVLVTVADQNPSPLTQDTVSSNVTVYFGDGNQVSSLISDTASEALHPHSFTLNKTITGGVIRTEGFDSENPTTKDVKTQTFTVAPTGIEFGDSTCTLDFITEAEAEADVGLDITIEAAANEGITTAIEDASNTFGVSPLVLVLILMLGWTIAVLTTKDRANDSMITMNKVIFMLIGNIFIFIIGSIVGAVSFGVLLVVMILGIFSVVLWARRQFTANNAV